MHWWQRLDTLQGQYDQAGGVPDTRYGLTLDQATAPWQNANQDYTEYLAKLQAEKQDSGIIGDFTKALGEVMDFGDPLFKVLAYPYKQLSTKVLSPISHVIPVMFNEDWQHQINADSAWDAMFDGRSWNHVMDVAKTDSFGRGIIESNLTLATMLNPDDPGYVGINDKMLNDYKDDWQFNVLSGGIDFASVMFLDPLYVAGKAGMASRALSSVTRVDTALAKHGNNFDNLMGSEPVARFLKWTDGKTPETIARHRALKRSPQAGLIADLLAHAPAPQKDLIYRIALGDQQAMADLQRTAPAVAAEYARLRGQVDFVQLKLLPSLSSTISSSNRARALSQADKDAALAPHREAADNFARDNRTELKLNDSEYNPLADAGHDPLAADGAFASRRLAQQRVYNTHATVYKPLFDADQTALLFNRSGQLERTPDDLQKAMREYHAFADDARASLRTTRFSEQAAKPRGKAKLNRARLGDGLGADELIPSRVVSPWSAKAQESLTGNRFVQEEAKAAEEAGDIQRARDIRASQKAVRASRRQRPRPALAPAMTQAEASQKYALWDYDVAGVADYQAKMKGQLDLFDDFLTPEIRQLDTDVGHYMRIVDDARALEQNGIRPGIFDSLHEVPVSSGFRASVSEGAVRVGSAIDLLYLRRYSGEMTHYGWLSRPVYYATKVADGLGRGLVPTTYKTADPEGWKDVDTWLKRVPDLSHDARKVWVRQLMGATDDVEKLRIVEQMEATVVRHMLHVHGIHDYETVKSITEVTLGSRKAYVGRMADTALERSEMVSPRGSAVGTYSAVDSTKGLAPMGLTPDGVAIVPGPLFVKQLLNEHPLLPIDDLNRAFERDGRWLYGEGSLGLRDNIITFGQIANRVWKTSVLMRVGYVVRTVSDEVLLAGAALGSLMYYGGAIPGAYRSARNVATRARNLESRALNRQAQFRRELPENILERPPHERGVGGVEVAPGMFARGVYEGPTGNPTKALTEADQKDLFSIYDNMLYQLRTGTNWGALDPKISPTSHLAAWTHALNHQLGTDKLGKIFLDGGGYDDALKWLATHEGRAYAKKLPHMARQRDDWIKSVAYTVDQYTLGDQALARAASRGEVTPAMLRQVPIEKRPGVHGGQIDYARGEGGPNEFFNKISDGFYTLASKMPTDKLVRHPVADLIYQKRLRGLVAKAEAQGVNIAEHPEKLYQMEEVSRQFAVKEIDRIFKDHLFSSPQTALRFVMPFFGAWRASIARWAHAVAEDPSIVARANQGWQGLHKPLDVVDPDGNLLDDQDSKVYGMNNKNSVIMRLPEPIAKALGGIPFVPGEESYGDAPGRAVPLKAFNTVLQGDPWYNAGFGPFVTVPLANIVRDSPYASKIAQETGILPFGARANWMQQALPTVGQRAVTADEGFDNAQYTSTFINILRTEVTRMSLEGKTFTQSDLAMVRQKTDDLSKLRMLESFLLPFSARPVYYGKEWEGKLPKDWQFLAAKFRQYRAAAATPEEGEEEFLKHFPEAWLYMQSTSENKSGIPANFESWDNAKKVQYLASKTPDIFDSAAGVQNKDYKKFDATVYDAQMAQEWNPGTGDHFREPRDPSTLVDIAQARAGWTKYSKFMDYLRGQLEQRGLKTVNDAGAKDLKAMKSDYIEYIGSTNEAWKNAYGSPDPARSTRIRAQARIVAADKNLATDPHRTLELQSLGYYLSGRDFFAAKLLERGKTPTGSPDIYAKVNRDLLTDWDDYREYLAQKDTRFSEIWLDRYFGNDYFQEMKR